MTMGSNWQMTRCYGLIDFEMCIIQTIWDELKMMRGKSAEQRDTSISAFPNDTS